MTSMRERAGEYLAMRRALGHRLEGQGRLLLDFTGQMDRAGQARLTTRDALEWACSTSAGPVTRRQQLVGFCTTKLSTLADLDLGQTPLQTASAAWSGVRRGLAYQDVSPAALVSHAAAGAGTGRAPLFEAVFTCETVRSIEGWAGLDITLSKPVWPALRQHVALEVSERDGIFDCVLGYRSALFDRQVMHAMLVTYGELLAGAAAPGAAGSRGRGGSAARIFTPQRRHPGA